MKTNRYNLDVLSATRVFLAQRYEQVAAFCQRELEMRIIDPCALCLITTAVTFIPGPFHSSTLPFIWKINAGEEMREILHPHIVSHEKCSVVGVNLDDFFLRYLVDF